MPARYDLLVLSPHLDDAALSVGGLIRERTAAGKSVVVATLFAGDPPAGPLPPLALRLHRAWGLEDAAAAAARREEDRAAMRLLGAAPLHLELPECIYRRDPASGEPLYPHLPAIFRRPKAPDRALAGELERRLAALPPADRVLAPLAVGGHVDHRLARQAAELRFGSRLELYEDFPYVRRFLALRRATGRRSGWETEVVPVGEEALRAQRDAVGAYASQLPTLFRHLADLEAKLRAQARKVGGERLWRRRARG